MNRDRYTPEGTRYDKEYCIQIEFEQEIYSTVDMQYYRLMQDGRVTKFSDGYWEQAQQSNHRYGENRYSSDSHIQYNSQIQIPQNATLKILEWKNGEWHESKNEDTKILIANMHRRILEESLTFDYDTFGEIFDNLIRNIQSLGREEITEYPYVEKYHTTYNLKHFIVQHSNKVVNAALPVTAAFGVEKLASKFASHFVHRFIGHSTAAKVGFSLCTMFVTGFATNVAQNYMMKDNERYCDYVDPSPTLQFGQRGGQKKQYSILGSLIQKLPDSVNVCSFIQNKLFHNDIGSALAHKGIPALYTSLLYGGTAFAIVSKTSIESPIIKGIIAVVPALATGFVAVVTSNTPVMPAQQYNYL